jgi:hypothetical protein
MIVEFKRSQRRKACLVLAAEDQLSRVRKTGADLRCGLG